MSCPHNYGYKLYKTLENLILFIICSSFKGSLIFIGGVGSWGGILSIQLFRFKDGAYYCYCAYVLRIARYSGFLWVVPTNTGIFLRSLKLYRESRTYQMSLVSQKKIGGNHAFFREN